MEDFEGGDCGEQHARGTMAPSLCRRITLSHLGLGSFVLGPFKQLFGLAAIFSSLGVSKSLCIQHENGICAIITPGAWDIKKLLSKTEKGKGVRKGKGRVTHKETAPAGT